MIEPSSRRANVNLAQIEQYEFVMILDIIVSTISHHMVTLRMDLFFFLEMTKMQKIVIFTPRRRRWRRRSGNTQLGKHICLFITAVTTYLFNILDI